MAEAGSLCPVLRHFPASLQTGDMPIDALLATVLAYANSVPEQEFTWERITRVKGKFSRVRAMAVLGGAGFATDQTILFGDWIDSYGASHMG